MAFLICICPNTLYNSPQERDRTWACRDDYGSRYQSIHNHTPPHPTPDRNTGEYVTYLKILLFFCDVYFFVCFQEAIESSYCHRIYLTEINKEFESDTFFPTFDKSTYRLLRYVIPRCYCPLQGTCMKILVSSKETVRFITIQGKLFRCWFEERRWLSWFAPVGQSL